MAEQIQHIEPAAAQDLLSIMQDAKSAGYRLGQICATLVSNSIEILYTLEKDNVLINYKFTVDSQSPEIQSATAVYPYAFVYENEMHDLFGVKFKNLSLDYGGTFYKIHEKTPWNPEAGKGGTN